jgi:BhlA holin family
MDLLSYVEAFAGTQTPFMLLFVALFFYFIKTARDREIEQNKILESKLSAVQEDVHVLIKVWQILLEKELEERK